MKLLTKTNVASNEFVPRRCSVQKYFSKLLSSTGHFENGHYVVVGKERIVELVKLCFSPPDLVSVEEVIVLECDFLTGREIGTDDVALTVIR